MRTRVDIGLTPVLEGCGEVVDLQFVPGSDDRAVVLDQGGTAWWVDFASGTTGKWLTMKVATGWERGLLGMAFHPNFSKNGRVVFNWTARGDEGLVSRVGMFEVAPEDPWRRSPEQLHLVYEVKQPYSNHNGGGVAFGPDGLLYIGWGDGGKAADPHGHGQNPGTALGAMLRVNVNGAAPFELPHDNPWGGSKEALGEVWAIGLRNPWRYSWDDQGRLIAADVGQNHWEEVGFVVAGGNHGWNIREGRHCHQPAIGCVETGMVEPFLEYDRIQGQSVTGGYVARQPAALSGRYVYGDFGSGRIWAVIPPKSVDEVATDVAAVGRFPLQISTFGRDASGRVYVADWRKGRVYRLDAGS